MIREIIQHWVPGLTIVKDSGGQAITNYLESHRDLVEVFDDNKKHICYRWETPVDRRKTERRTIQWENY